MVDHLPSMPALRALEAAARLGSYSRAAEELHLTHGAVSHQIRQLEARLGRRLFRREGHRMAPTAAGRLLVEDVGRALAILDRAFGTGAKPPQHQRRNRQPLRVATLPSFASHWLVPHLAAFQAAHPDIDIELMTSHEAMDLERDGVDLAIRFGRGRWPGAMAAKLLDEVVFPTCSPAFLAAHPIAVPADLARLPLLRFLRRSVWANWFEAAGAVPFEPQEGAVFDDPVHLQQATVAGQGVGLVRSLLAQDDLAQGRLIRLFEATVPASGDYYVVWRPDHPRQPAITAFRDWLVAAITSQAAV
jgi:LysR family glycine cleavage system transcriptional activator